MKSRIPDTKEYRADIVLPPCGIKHGCTVHVRLTKEEVPAVQALADKLGMSLDALVRYYLSRDQTLKVQAEERLAIRFDRISLTPALSGETMARLRRAAAFYNESPETFFADAISSKIAGAEETMLIHPCSGELIGYDFLAGLLLREVDYA